MKIYKIELDEAVSNFFEEIAIIVQRPVEDILSDTLCKQVKVISRKMTESIVINDGNMS